MTQIIYDINRVIVNFFDKIIREFILFCAALLLSILAILTKFVFENYYFLGDKQIYQNFYYNLCL